MATRSCELDFRPMTHFNGRPCEWKPKRWKNGLEHTINALRDELDRSEITDALIETYHARSDYTISGRPRSGANPDNPSVQIFFKIGETPICIPCSRFCEWPENLKAIQMALRSKRLEREYGCSTIEEQYRGHAQLPSGEISNHVYQKSVAIVSARLILTVSRNTDFKSDDLLEDEGTLDSVFKEASINAHPDKGGSTELMSSINKARDVIRSSNGWS